MAFHETYQVYNPQNKQFVKMRNGEILECSYFKFEGVPLFGGAPDPPPEATEKEDSENTRHSKNDTTSGDKNGAEKEPEEDNSDFFEWF